MKSRVFLKGIAFLAVLIISLYGCGVGGDNTGRLSLSLTDKPTHDYKEVWVTIQDVYVHKESDPEGSWTKVLDVNKTLNMLTLANVFSHRHPNLFLSDLYIPNQISPFSRIIICIT